MSSGQVGVPAIFIVIGAVLFVTVFARPELLWDSTIVAALRRWTSDQLVTVWFGSMGLLLVGAALWKLYKLVR